MKFSLNRQFVLFVVVAMLAVACSADPEEKKMSLVESGRKYFAEGQFKEAVIQFRRAIQIDPEFAEAHYRLAQAFEEDRRAFLAYRGSRAGFADSDPDRVGLVWGRCPSPSAARSLDMQEKPFGLPRRLKQASF